MKIEIAEQRRRKWLKSLCKGNKVIVFNNYCDNSSYVAKISYVGEHTFDNTRSRRLPVTDAVIRLSRGTFFLQDNGVGLGGHGSRIIPWTKKEEKRIKERDELNFLRSFFNVHFSWNDQPLQVLRKIKKIAIVSKYNKWTGEQCMCCKQE